MKVDESQSEFYSCYRQRQSWLHDHAYLRTGKTIFIEDLLRRANVRLESSRVCDYGFGAGAFFLKCPLSTHLAGIELDEKAVAELRKRLVDLGYQQPDLRTFETPEDDSIPWPRESFDLVICSHVLEHCSHPEELVLRLSHLVRSGGHLVALVPVNERAKDPKHLIRFDRSKLEAVCAVSGFRIVACEEADEWMYWCQPVFLREGRGARFIAQALSLSMGFALCSLGPVFWRRLGRVWAAITRAQPAQAAIILKKE